jgi:hypothetical protein
MLAAQDWDVGLVDQWTQTKNEKAVLSTYVPDLKELVDPSFRNARNEVPVICRLAFNKDGMPRNVPATNAMRLSKPKLSTLWAAGFSFSKCHADAVVPYDPHLPQIFDGKAVMIGPRQNALLLLLVVVVVVVVVIVMHFSSCFALLCFALWSFLRPVCVSL